MHSKNQALPFDHQMVAVVVTYHPDPAVLENVRLLTEQVGKVIVVDNGSAGPSAGTVSALEKMPGVLLIRNAVNLGIATAMNTGIRHALTMDCAWIATFDQDSTVPGHYFEDLLNACASCPTAEKVGIIVPGQWTTMHARKSSTGSPCFITAAPNSGSLIRANVFSSVGFFDDAMFIDYVDVDYCLRVQKSGFRVLSVSGVVLGHELGTQESRTVLGWRISFRVHTAWRYYYIMRNRVVMYGRHGWHFPRWMLHDAFWVILELGRMTCLESGKRHKLRCALRGLWDGLRGRQGRHPLFP